MTLKELAKGEWFTLKPIAEPKESQVFVKGEYDRSDRTYECTKWSDISEAKYLKGDTKVYTDFIF